MNSTSLIREFSLSKGQDYLLDTVNRYYANQSHLVQFRLLAKDGEKLSLAERARRLSDIFHEEFDLSRVIKTMVVSAPRLPGHALLVYPGSKTHIDLEKTLSVALESRYGKDGVKFVAKNAKLSDDLPIGSIEDACGPFIDEINFNTFVSYIFFDRDIFHSDQLLDFGVGSLIRSPKMVSEKREGGGALAQDSEVMVEEIIVQKGYKIWREENPLGNLMLYSKTFDENSEDRNRVERYISRRNRNNNSKNAKDATRGASILMPSRIAFDVLLSHPRHPYIVGLFRPIIK